MQKEIIRVTKAFTFDMAHALLHYDGPCKHIHGHTYRLEVTLGGYLQQETVAPKMGMLIDFTQLKELVKRNVIDKYDHALVLNDALPPTLKAYAQSLTGQLHLVPFQPTAENLLLEIKQTLQNALANEGYRLYALRLSETPTSWAEWRLEDQLNSFQ